MLVVLAELVEGFEEVAGLAAGVAVERGKGGGSIGEGFEGEGEAGGVGGGVEELAELRGEGVGFEVEEADLDEVGAAAEVLGAGSVLDEKEFEVIGDLGAVEEGFGKALENLLFGGREEGGGGGEPLSEGIAGRDGFALRGTGAAGERAIAAGGVAVFLRSGWHKHWGLARTSESARKIAGGMGEGRG